MVSLHIQMILYQFPLKNASSEMVTQLILMQL